MTTIDLDRAASDLREHGLCIVPGALDDDTLRTARAALYDAAARDRAEGREVRFALDYATDTTNQRVWNLPNRHPVFCALAEHPAALALVRGHARLAGIAVEHQRQHHGSGRRRDGVARRSVYMPQPWSGHQGINVLWCLDDFTDENGAPRSFPAATSTTVPRPPTIRRDTVAIEAPAGSMVAMEGRMWHKTGNNRTADERRAGRVRLVHDRRSTDRRENWFLALDDQVIDNGVRRPARPVRLPGDRPRARERRVTPLGVEGYSVWSNASARPSNSQRSSSGARRCEEAEQLLEHLDGIAGEDDCAHGRGASVDAHNRTRLDHRVDVGAGRIQSDRAAAGRPGARLERGFRARRRTTGMPG